MVCEQYQSKTGWVCNRQVGIPENFTEDIKKFSVNNVDNTVIQKQFTELQGNEYIIKEVRLFFSGTAANDAYFHLNKFAADGAGGRFAEGYYWEGSFVIFNGNRNGPLNDVLRTKPYLYVTAGTGAAAQTVYGSIHYFYR